MILIPRNESNSTDSNRNDSNGFEKIIPLKTISIQTSQFHSLLFFQNVLFK